MFSLLREKFAQRFLHLIRLGRLLIFVSASREDACKYVVVVIVPVPLVKLGRLARRVVVDCVIVFEQVVDIVFLVSVGLQPSEMIRSSGRRFLEIDEYDALATTPDVFVDVVEAEDYPKAIV